MTTQFTTNQQKQEITQKLNSQFGISLSQDNLLIESSKEKIRLFTGNLTKEQIQEIEAIAPIEAIGLYFFKEEKDAQLRLSLDATHILKDNITKNVTNLNDNEASQWMQGNDLNKKAPKSIQVIQHNSDFLVCAKSTGEVLLNHIPKDRRIR